jgi:hypothetical protein
MAVASYAADFTPEGMKWEPAPSGHAVGKDNAPESGVSQGNGKHMAGSDCGICHTPNGKAGTFVFSVAGTLFKDKAGTQPLANGEIILQDVTGNVISMTSNEAGNFFTYTAIASDPVKGSDPSVSGTWTYKSWVKYGDTVRPMVTIAPVGGMTSAARMSCNMHHGWQGSRGSLSAGRFATLSSYPSSGVSFKQHVLPILKNKCKACHVPGSAGSTTTYGKYTYDYSGGLDLSSYSKDSKSAKGVSDVVSVSSPSGSGMLTKTLIGSTHAGGEFWDTTDADYNAILQWIKEGAANN